MNENIYISNSHAESGEVRSLLLCSTTIKTLENIHDLKLTRAKTRAVTWPGLQGS